MASNEGEDSHTKGKTIKERLKMMLNNNVMSDVTFVTKDAMEDVVVFKAHKFVLAVSSPVFYAMFYGRLSEIREKTKSSYLTVTLRAFLNSFGFFIVMKLTSLGVRCCKFYTWQRSI